MNNVFPTIEVYYLFLQIVATVGLDKKLYTLDSGSRRPTHTIAHEAPFSSLAYNDDGTILAAGTNSGRVVFYDVRGKPKPFTILRAYNTSEVRDHNFLLFGLQIVVDLQKILFHVVLCTLICAHKGIAVPLEKVYSDQYYYFVVVRHIFLVL